MFVSFLEPAAMVDMDKYITLRVTVKGYSRKDPNVSPRTPSLRAAAHLTRCEFGHPDSSPKLKGCSENSRDVPE